MNATNGNRAAVGSPDIASTGHGRWIEWLFLACLISGLTVNLQFRLGAYDAEFDDDEASHYVSGLLIRDYLAGWLPGSPLGFVRRFHSFYPLVGIGHWGPAYY